MTTLLDLSVRRGNKLVLNGTRIDIPAGTVTGLVAPNGSGKTTLLESIREPWDKRVTCTIGLDAGEDTPTSTGWRRGVFYLPSPDVLSARATVRQNVEFARDCWRSQADIDKLASRLGIETFLDLPVRKCSQGMAQLAAITTAMATGAKILLLDEPMSALDPTNVGVATSAMRSYVRGRRSIVMSTHNLANVDQSCDRVAFIVNGKIECRNRPRNHPGSCARRYQELYETGQS